MKPNYLRQPIEPVEVKDRKISELTDAMLNTGFQGRKLAEAVNVWDAMLRERDITIFMGLSGAMVPAGMRKIIAYMIEKRMIDCLVSTGANIFHDIHEALRKKHYRGSHLADDRSLYKHGIDRIYDVFALEKQFRDTDEFIAEFAKSLDSGVEYSSREFLHLLGKKISGKGEKSIVTAAYKANVPIFVPAVCDSSIGIGLMMSRRRGHSILVNQIKDVDEITQIVEQSGKTGVIYVGGGVPKNFIQQTEVISSIMGLELGGHDYALQIVADSPQWGGLSGSTFEEAISWGKIAPVAKKVQVYVDATIALPIISHALAEKSKNAIRKRSQPTYDWSSGKLKLKRKP